MAGLVAQIETTAGSNVWVEMARFTNTNGTPIVSVEILDFFQLLPGTYQFTFANVVAETDADVSVVCPLNPNRTRVSHPAVTVALDGVTVESSVIRGLGIVFSDSASFTNSWTATINIGIDQGSRPNFGSSLGQSSNARKVRVENTGTDEALNCKARLLPKSKVWATSGEIFENVRIFSEDLVEKITSGQIEPYAITVSNVTGSGAAKTFDLLVDASLVDVVLLDDMGNPDGGEITSEDLTVVDWYRITSGDLTGLEFLLSQAAIVTDTANLLVFSVRFVRIAPDENGSAGTFGTTDVVLTEEDQPAGAIRAGGFAFFHIDVVVTSSGVTRSNPYCCDVNLYAETGVEAGFSA